MPEKYHWTPKEVVEKIAFPDRKPRAQEKLEELLKEEKTEIPEERLEFFNLEEAKEILGEKEVCGPKDVERHFLGGKSLEQVFSPAELESIQKIPYSREDLEKAKQLGEILVLRVPKMEVNGKIVPVTIEHLKEKFPDYFYSQGWYNQEDFFLRQTPQLEWKLIKKEVLRESLDKDYQAQEQVLQEYIKKNHLNPKKTRRRTPIEITYDTFLYFQKNQERLLESTYDRTNVRSSGGYPVDVGHFDRDGLDVSYWRAESRHGNLGFCPCR